MAKLRDAVLTQDRGLTIGRQNSVVNIRDSGQQGWAPALEAIDSHASHVRRNLIAFLVQPPGGFKDLPDSQDWIAALKAMVERHATRIEGLRAGLNVEWAEVALSGAGEMQQDVANVTRERSEPVFTWPEKYGKPFKIVLEGWILNLLGDPHNKTPMVMTRGLTERPDFLPSYRGMSVVFIETDPSGTRVVEAWLSTNMMPSTTGPIEGSKDITAGGEIIEMSIPFSAITQYSIGVRVWAQKLLDDMNLVNANPYQQPAMIDKIDADVLAADDSGYMDQIAEANDAWQL